MLRQGQRIRGRGFFTGGQCLHPRDGREAQAGACQSHFGLDGRTAGGVLRALGLVEVGSRQVTRLEAPFHVGCQRGRIVQAAQGGRALGLGRPDLPVGFADFAGQLPLRAVKRLALQFLFGASQQRFALPLAGQPQRHRQFRFDLARPEVAVQPVASLAHADARR